MGFFSIEFNYRWFGEDSFDLQGNHNQMVDIRKELAIERGATWVEMDVTKMISDEVFSLIATLEPFFEDAFWRCWKILYFFTWVLLAVFYGSGMYKDFKKRKGIVRKTSKYCFMRFLASVNTLVFWLLVQFRWAFECFDYLKDWTYLLLLKHNMTTLFLLIISLVLPYVIQDSILQLKRVESTMV